MRARELKFLSLVCSNIFKSFKTVENRNSAADFNKHKPGEVE